MNESRCASPGVAILRGSPARVPGRRCIPPPASDSGLLRSAHGSERRRGRHRAARISPTLSKTPSAICLGQVLRLRLSTGNRGSMRERTIARAVLADDPDLLGALGHPDRLPARGGTGWGEQSAVSAQYAVTLPAHCAAAVAVTLPPHRPPSVGACSSNPNSLHSLSVENLLQRESRKP
jgi:hypothetical protein